MRLTAKAALGLILGISANTLAAPTRLTTLRYPVSFKETAKKHALAIGASSIALELEKTDLELVIWRTQKTFALEVNIDVSQINQSILPTDASGRLLTKVTQLDAVPWIKVYLAGQAPQTLDVICDSRKKQCQGVWKNFPYDISKQQMLKVEANLRGLEGKIWSPILNTYTLHPDRGDSLGIKRATLSPIYNIKPKAQPARIEVKRLYDLLQFPAYFANLKLLSIYEWTFMNDTQIRESGFFKTLRKTLFHIDEGHVLLETHSQNSLQTIEMLADQTFFAEAGTILSLASKRLSQKNEARVRIFEFE
jgi:hypothetical protein